MSHRTGHFPAYPAINAGDGMDFRCYLVGQALAGYCANSEKKLLLMTPEQIAIACAEVADACLDLLAEDGSIPCRPGNP